LRTVAEGLESPMPAQVGSIVAPEEALPFRRLAGVGQAEAEDPRGTGKLVSALPVRETSNAGLRYAAYLPDGAANSLLEPALNVPTTVADVPFKLAAARQAAYQQLETQSRRSPILLLLLLGLVVFALFFVVGYFTGHILFAH